MPLIALLKSFLTALTAQPSPLGSKREEASGDILLNNHIPDVQSLRPAHEIPIEMVGVENVYRTICLENVKGRLCMGAKIDMFVDLPKERRGAHVSRSIEALIDLIGLERYNSFETFEKALELLCRELLSRHEYARNAKIRARIKFPYEYLDPQLNLNDAVPVNLVVSVKADKGSNYTAKEVCVEVIGMTVCPCAQQVCNRLLNTTDTKFTPSHTQRTRLKLCVTSRKGPIDVNELVAAALNSFSAPVLSYLKRDKECKLVIRGFENAKLVEDVVRDALFQAYQRLKSTLEPDAVIKVDVKSYESIHPFNVRARARHLLRELSTLINNSE